ncbi:hypothetical protein [Propionivibrio limicola]|uniref:hypothetical protein n=1 Tax=Propionivibrio limicola TaxID=167645 RepID=UPI00129278EA|nr:hypothetical protein [Propionivibrio limicola]
MTRLERRIALVEAARRRGQPGFVVVRRDDGESEEEALQRAGLPADYGGVVVFMSHEDIAL